MISLRRFEKIHPIHLQIFAHWVYILFSIDISPNLHGIFHVLIIYLIIISLYKFLTKKRKINFSLLSFLAVVNSTYLNFQYSQAKKWPLLLTCCIAIFFKMVLRDRETKSSLINPAYLAIAFVTFCFPTLGGFSLLFWSGNWYHTIIVIVLGTIVTLHSKSISLPFSYFVGHIVFAYLIEALGSAFAPDYFSIRPSLTINLSLFSFGYLIFIFHVISDPISGPQKIKDQILFGLMMSFLDVIFKYVDMNPSTPISYLLTTIFWIWVKQYRKQYHYCSATV